MTKTSSHLFIRLGNYIFVGLITFFLIFSGIIDFFPIINDRYIPLVDIPNNEIATWIRDNTSPDAIVLNSSYFFHPASIAGRKIFMGWPYFPWSAGYDTLTRAAEMQAMYDVTNHVTQCTLLRTYNISYITVENTANDPNLPFINISMYDAYTPVYTSFSGTYRIFSIHDLCN